MNRRKIIGPRHPNYKRGKTIGSGGYVELSSKIHGASYRQREHRVVMARKLGRPLRSTEIVHHIDGDPANNRVSNLRIETRASHNRLHARGGKLLVCAECGAERWYTPGLMKRMTADRYMCRMCRYGHTWDNGAKT
jgi:hypothetical protein